LHINPFLFDRAEQTVQTKLFLFLVEIFDNHSHEQVQEEQGQENHHKESVNYEDLIFIGPKVEARIYSINHLPHDVNPRFS
jgi:hypothetical protein